jgi:hypothetical protein
VSPVETGQQRRDRIMPRYQFDARIGIEVVRDGKTTCTEGWIRDLSESGVGVFVGSALAVGEKTNLKIPLSNNFDLVVPAIVTRARGTHYGFQFTALSGKQREQLRLATIGRTPIADDAFLY